MAPSRRLLSILLLFFIIFSSQTQARIVRSFSKFNSQSRAHQNPPTASTGVAVTTNQTAPGEQVPRFIPETGNAYGLYGHERDVGDKQAFPEPSYGQKDSYPAEDSHGRNSHSSGFHDRSLDYQNYYQEKERFGGNRVRGAGYDVGNSINGRGFGYELQGMSDTRFLENGKYSYDVENEKRFSHPNYYYYSPSRYYSGYGDSRNYEEYRNNGYRGMSSSSNVRKYQRRQDGIEEEEELEFEP